MVLTQYGNPAQSNNSQINVWGGQKNRNVLSPYSHYIAKNWRKLGIGREGAAAAIAPRPLAHKGAGMPRPLAHKGGGWRRMGLGRNYSPQSTLHQRVGNNSEAYQQNSQTQGYIQQIQQQIQQLQEQLQQFQQGY